MSESDPAAVDSIAEAADRMAANFDGMDVAPAAGVLATYLIRQDLDADTLAKAVAVLALRNRRTLEAAAQMGAPRPAPTRSTLATLAPLLVVLAAMLGGFGGAWLAVTLGVLR